MNISPFNFYRNQCRVLEEQLSYAEGISKKYSSPDDVSVPVADLLWPQSALTELRRVLTVGRCLIEGCNNESNCFKAYLRQDERTQAFAETLREIVWCMSVVFYYNSKGCSMAKDDFPFARLGAHKELHMLQKAAAADQTELLTSLDIWIQNHVCSAQGCGGPQHQADDDPPLCFAALIFRRRSDVDSLVVDHTSLLWNINSKVLKDGKFIGQGGYCSVIKTTWLGDTYAKKIFEMDSPEVFRNEANALSKLRHPHMVTALAYTVGSGKFSLLMERMPHDLRQHMDRRLHVGIDPPFSISAAIDLMLQVAEATAYMHSQKMVHRDLKPGNILVKAVDDPELRKEGFVVAKLADFGQAKLKLHQVTNYSRETKNPGMIPFRNVKAAELYNHITDPYIPLRPELPESCPESLASLIEECWHTDPERRPAFTEICRMLSYLKALLMLTGQAAHMGTSSQKSPVDGQVQRWMAEPFRTEPKVQYKQISNASPPASLVYTTFDGSSWTDAIRLPHGMASPNGACLANYDGTLVAVHRTFSGSLYWNTYTDSSWTLPKIIVRHDSPSRPASSQPALAILRDRLVCLYRGSQDRIWCTSIAGPNLRNDGKWTEPLNAGGSAATSDGPALAVFGDLLFSAVRCRGSSIYWNCSSNGADWSTYLEFNHKPVTGASPALVVYKNELYCFFQSIPGLFAGSKFSVGIDCWSAFYFYVRDFDFSSPSFTVFKDQLVHTIRGAGNQLSYGIIVSVVSPPCRVIKVPAQFCQGEQGLCAIDSKLFCVYTPPPLQMLEKLMWVMDYGMEMNTLEISNGS